MQNAKFLKLGLVVSLEYLSCSYSFTATQSWHELQAREALIVFISNTATLVTSEMYETDNMLTRMSHIMEFK